MKINIGAGSTRFDGFVNCDYSDMYNPEYVFDLEKDKWPFEDNSVDEVIAHHVLEHLGDGYFHALKELYRVCKGGTRVSVHVPHHRSEDFFHDATHRRAITPFGLQMFSKSQNERDRIANAATSRLGFYLDVDFEVVSSKHILSNVHPLYDRLKNLSETELAEYAYEKSNVYSEVQVEMRVIK